MTLADLLDYRDALWELEEFAFGVEDVDYDFARGHLYSPFALDFLIERLERARVASGRVRRSTGL